jgi:Vps51/Vps67
MLFVQRLDSDMQTLVYENYNKFIAATETIRNDLICTCYLVKISENSYPTSANNVFGIITAVK